MGYSRDSFYRFKELYETSGDEALTEIAEEKPVVKSRCEPAVEDAIIKMAFDQPTHGQVRVSNDFKKQGYLTSPGGVRSVRLRHDSETFKKRWKAIEARVAQEAGVLAEVQVVAVERTRQEPETQGQIETKNPGYFSGGMTKTYFTLAPSRTLDASISKRLSTRAQKLHSLSYMDARMR